MEMAISAATLSLPCAQIPRRTSKSLPFSFSSSKSSFFSTNTQLSQWKRTNCSLDLDRTVARTSRRRGFSCKCLFGLGVPELVVIAGVAALLFGPRQLPEVGRSIGKTVKSFQQAAKEFETELKKEPDSAAESPTAVSEEDKEDAKVSSMKESL